MASSIMITTSAGVFVLDPSYALQDTVLFSEGDLLKASEDLKNGRFTASEKSMAKKHGSAGEILFLGFKNEQLQGVRAVQDISMLTKAGEALRSKGFFPAMRRNEIVLARKMVSQSVIQDLFIVQAAKSLGELEHILNQLVRRLRDWYAYHLPEFSEGLRNNEKFAELVVAKDKKTLLAEIKLSAERSMGVDLGKEDLAAVLLLAKEINALYAFKKKQELYLEQLMQKTCPNITTVAGYAIAAKLIELAGSLKRLSEFPASTIQVLGAEKALFRHLRSGARCPKHGILHEHRLVANAPPRRAGKAARILADKLAIAAKVDYFRGKFIGKKLRDDVESLMRMV